MAPAARSGRPGRDGAAGAIVVGGVGPALATLGVQAAAQTPAAATGSYTCTDTLSPWGWTGEDLQPAGKQGVIAVIEHEQPYLCTPPSGYTEYPASSAWAMMYDSSDPNAHLFQSGWIKYAGWTSSTEFFFYECNGCETLDGGSVPDYAVQFGAVPSPSNTSYSDTAEDWVGTEGGDFHMKIVPANDPGGTTYGITLKAGSSWTPDSIAISTEVHDYKTQTAGTTESPASFSTIQLLQSSGSWVNANLNSGDWTHMPTTAEYGEYSVGSNTDFSTWDTRY